MQNLIFKKTQIDQIGAAQGLELLAPDYDFCVSYEGTDGVQVELKNFVGKTMTVDFKDGKAVFAFDFSRRILFFRCVSSLLLCLKAGKKELLLTESTHFTTNGPMLDLSQGNMVLRVDFMKEFLRRMAFMGLNMCMLYMEDNYVVPEEPYFGHMRSRYTYEELKEMDDYADIFGIEMIPAIQTLAHQETVMQWDVYKPIRENRRCMLPKEPKTYEFIRHILAAVTKPFRSRRVHIGMDEAGFLGHGTHFRRYGIVPSHEILMDHLARVCKITEEMGLIPMVWNDGFKLTRPQQEQGSASMYMEDAHPDLQVTNWAYSPYEPEWYEERIRANRRKDYGGVYCNTAWTWLGFGPNWNVTLGNMNSMIASRNTNVYEAILSFWMVGFDSDFRINYLGMQIFAEYCYYVKPTREQIKERFELSTDGDFDALWDLQLLNEVPGVPEGNYSNRPSSATEFLLWQDPMCGMFDKDIEEFDMDGFFAEKEKILAVQAEKARGTSFEPTMEFYRRLASLLALKSNLGNKMTKAYRDGNKAELRRLAEEVIPEAVRRAEAMQQQARLCWMQIGLPLGWEATDLHYGGTIIRLKSAAQELTDYLEGRREKLEELDAPRLSYIRANMGFAGKIPAWTDKWGRMCSASLVAPEYWFALPKDIINPEGV